MQRVDNISTDSTCLVAQVSMNHLQGCAMSPERQKGKFYRLLYILLANQLQPQDLILRLYNILKKFTMSVLGVLFFSTASECELNPNTPQRNLKNLSLLFIPFYILSCRILLLNFMLLYVHFCLIHQHQTKTDTESLVFMLGPSWADGLYVGANTSASS